MPCPSQHLNPLQNFGVCRSARPAQCVGKCTHVAYVAGSNPIVHAGVLWGGELWKVEGRCKARSLIQGQPHSHSWAVEGIRHPIICCTAVRVPQRAKERWLVVRWFCFWSKSTGASIFWPIVLRAILTPPAGHQQVAGTPTTPQLVAGVIVCPNGGLKAARSPPQRARQKELNSTGWHSMR
jgi:hypothetical protein